MKPSLLDRYPEGRYTLTLRGQSFAIELRDTYLFESPNRQEARLAYWLDGFPRFPRRLTELIEWGGVLERC